MLSGQPELDRKLDAPNLRQLKQRLVLRCTLNPLTEVECAEYIESRTGSRGLKNQTLFSRELMSEIFLRARGIPRVINAICDNLLVTMFAMEQRSATSQCSTKCVAICAWNGRAATASGVDVPVSAWVKNTFPETPVSIGGD